MGFITKNHCKGKLDFLNYYGFDYEEEGYSYYTHYTNKEEETDSCWISRELCGFDEIVVIINETGTKVTVDIMNLNYNKFTTWVEFTQRHQTFEINCSTDNEKEYIETLDEIVTTYIEDQGCNWFHNIDNRY